MPGVEVDYHCEKTPLKKIKNKNNEISGSPAVSD